MKIRKMSPEDYDELVRVWSAAGLTYRPVGRDGRKSIGNQMEKFGDLMVVAEEKGRIVGSAVGSHDHRKGWINRVAVLPDCRRKGVAKKMVRYLEKEFGKLELKVLCILIEDDNVASRGLFEEMGYSTLDKVKYYSKRPSWDV